MDGLWGTVQSIGNWGSEEVWRGLKRRRSFIIRFIFVFWNPFEDASEWYMLDHNSLAENLRIVHLEEPLVHLPPCRDGRGDRVELW